ncbi:MAG: hypothetical protein HYX41_01410 [Bdellovibrio sp.]|nr:hypothetical protein [Bdellovibrio sp.]
MGASINGSPVTSVGPAVTVVPGTFSLAQSAISVSSSAIQSGEQATVTLVAKDSSGNQLSGGGLNIGFTQSIAGMGSFGAVSDHGNGVYSASFTGIVAGGPDLLSATINGGSLTSSPASISVNPGAVSLSQTLISVSSSSVTAGSFITVSVTPKDTNGNLINNAGLNLGLSYSGGTSQGTWGPISYSNGVYSASFTGTASGTPVTLGATIGGAALTSAGPSVTVNPGALSLANSLVTVSASTVASGSSIVAKLAPKDALGNSILSSGLSVVFSISGGTSTGSFSGVTYNSANGEYSSNFTGILAGTSVNVKAAIGGSEVTSSSPSVTVVPGAMSLAGSTLTSSGSSVVAGSSVTLTLTVRDAAGNALGSVASGLVVTFNATGGTSTGSISAVQETSGVYTAQFTGVHAGTALTIGGTISGGAVSSALPSIVVVPGAVSLAQSLVSVSAGTVSSGSQITVTLTAKDAQGNLMTSGGLNVSFAQSVSGMGLFGSVVDAGNGTYSASFTGVVAGGPDLLSGLIGGAALTSSPASVNVIPGAVSVSQSTLASAASSVNVGQGTVLTVTVRDANGNLLSQGGASISFSIQSGTSTGTFSSVTDNHNGTYTATFTGTGGGTAAVIKASVNGSLLNGSASVTVSNSGMNIEVPIEMIDSPLAGKSSTYLFNVSRTNLNTSDYDGTVSYAFEVVASNGSNNPYNVTLISASGAALRTHTIPANTPSGRYRNSFTPTTGASTYRISIDGASNNQLVVTTARIIVSQVGATKTKLYIPLLSNNYMKVKRRAAQWIDYNGGSNYAQGFGSAGYSIWYKDVSKYSSLAATNPWTFDAVLWKDHGSEDNEKEDDDDISDSATNTCRAALFNASTNAQVNASTVSTLTGTPTLLSASFADSTAGFADQTNYKVMISGPNGDGGRCYIGKAGLWVALESLSHAEVFYRIAKSHWGTGNSNGNDGYNGYGYWYWYWYGGYYIAETSGTDNSSRALIDLSKFPSSAQPFYEVTGMATTNASLSAAPFDVGTADVGYVSAQAASCSVSASNIGTSWNRYRTGACTGIVSGDRYVNGLTSSNGNLFTANSFIVIGF